jgi:hypothetical protein
MPYIQGDRVVVTDEGSAYCGETGVVTEYYGDFDFPKVDVKLDNYFGNVCFYETAIAIGESFDKQEVANDAISYLRAAYDRQYETPSIYVTVSKSDLGRVLALVECLTAEVEYEYNLRHFGKVFYDTWQTEKEITALWMVKGLDTITENLPEGFTLVRRIRSEIEDV